MSKYSELNYNLINGSWRDGRSSHEIVTSNPYTGEEIARFKSASSDDLNKAYESLEKAQVDVC